MKTAYINAVLLDGTREMVPTTGQTIVVENGKIKEITRERGDMARCRVIDLNGRYLMPGLINLHVHLPANGKPKDKPSDTVKAVHFITKNAFTRMIGRKICASNAKTELLSGVTTIRTVGGVADFDTRIRNDIRRKKILGPHILAGDMAISVPGGHMAGSLAYAAAGCEDMVKYVERVARTKPDLIKLMITGGVLDATKEGEPGELKMPPEYVRAGCKRAHELGFRVAAHVESSEGLRVALENGVDTIEHGAVPDLRILQLFRDREAALVTTLSPTLPFALFKQSVSHVSDANKVNGNIVFDGIVACAKACLYNGIPVGLGTDTGCPYTTHYNMWRELVLFHRFCEVSNAFALHTATLQNAQIAGIDRVTGSIAVGKDADFLITRKNPLEDLHALKTVEMVVVSGHVITQPHVAKMPQVEHELDKFM